MSTYRFHYFVSPKVLIILRFGNTKHTFVSPKHHRNIRFGETKTPVLVFQAG